MNKLFHGKRLLCKKTNLSPFVTLAIYCTFAAFCLLAQTTHEKDAMKNNGTDEQLIDSFVNSRGPTVVFFDSSNIKMFWTDNSVVAYPNQFSIRMKQLQNGKHESSPLKIQLANVNIFQDCKIDIISETSDLSFAITDNNSKNLSRSSQEEDFIHYHVYTALLHLDDTNDFSFYMKFSSPSSDSVTIKKIILTFPQNANYLSSPGTLTITPTSHDSDLNFYLSNNGGKLISTESSSFTVKGKTPHVFSKKKIYVSSNPISYTLKIKNTGNEATRVYVGFAPYTKDGKRINMKNNLYKENKILKVVSSKENSSTIIVDKYPEWKNGCFLALNAQDDCSDFPNFSIIDNKIINVKTIDDSQTEITFANPLKEAIKTGTSTRIQSPDGYTYLYMHNVILQPGEEVSLSSTIKKDDAFLEFSPKAFCRGTHYVVPLIMSHSIDTQKENTIQVIDYKVSY